ncbi:MAG: DUF1475 family protein [Acidobacteria bacterium]|nr:DUF1475 family protein [Acidobacteriota bacterium]
MIQWIRWVSFVLAVQMVVGVVATAMESNLWEEGSALLEIPWMVATLQDFYTNVAFIGAWIFWRERHWPARLVWLIALVGLGSIATALYVFWQSFNLDTQCPVRHLLLGRHLDASGEVQ